MPHLKAQVEAPSYNRNSVLPRNFHSWTAAFFVKNLVFEIFVPKHQFICDATLAGQRLDAVIAARIPELSKRKAKTVVDVGGVFVNRKRVRIASKTVNQGDKIEVSYSDAYLTRADRGLVQLSDHDIVFLDDWLAVINKPPGLPSQATLDQDVDHVIPALTRYLKSKNLETKELTLLHRLDKETTGLLLIARKEFVAQELLAGFKERKIKKIYHAICHGILQHRSFHDSCFLSPIEGKSGLVRVVKVGGKIAVTDFTMLESFPKANVTVMSCAPHTGRSHQLRVQLTKNNLPIVGDKKYGDSNQTQISAELRSAVPNYHFLHARALEFTLRGKTYSFEAPYPKEFEHFLQLLRANSSVPSAD